MDITHLTIRRVHPRMSLGEIVNHNGVTHYFVNPRTWKLKYGTH
jgi:hypothetical protein